MRNEIKKRVKLFYLVKDNLSIIFSWIIITTVALFFQSQIALFIGNNSIITYKEVKSDFFDFAYLIFLIILSFRFLWFIIKNYRLSKKQNYFIFLLAVIYIILRNNEYDSLVFSYYSNTYDFYYADVIIIVSMLSLILLIRNVFDTNYKLYDTLIKWFDNLGNASNITEDSFLLEDIPVEETKLNDNEKVIDEVVSAVRNLNPQKSFIIGVNSIWGLGKTSFLKRLEYKLKNDSFVEGIPITFWFNAWQHQDEKSIINNFFNQLKKELSIFSGDSENVIDGYLKEMLALVDNKYLAFFKSITDTLFSDQGNTIKVFYDDINNIIEKTDRKIIVFVDDIDRLNKNEILETLRILRNIADFKNVVFICGFDREYVVRQSQIDEHYLDKIFNLEINLTAQGQKSFVAYLNQLIIDSNGYNTDEKDCLTESINKIFYDTNEEVIFNIDLIHQTNNQNSEMVDPWLQTDLIPSFFFESRRDVKKFFNELFVNIKTLKNIKDIDLEEYLLLKLLLFKYKWIYKNFTSRHINTWLGSEVTLKFEQSNLDNLIIIPNLHIHDKVIIYSILKSLFPLDGVYNNSKNINQKRYFPIYFGNNVFNEAFSFTELTKALEDIKIGELIENNVLGKENENLIKNDIKGFVLKKENIKNIDEYKQVIELVKNDYLGFIDEEEVLDFIYLGETIFAGEFEEMLSTIFTNFSDSFASFMQELSIHYSKIPNNVSFNTRINIGSHVNSEKIKQFKILTKEKLLEILLKILISEIEENKEDVKKVLRFSIFFSEKYFVLFEFKVFYEEFKRIIVEYFTEQFETIFLQHSPRETLLNMNYPFFANVFEDLDERTTIIEQAETLINERNQWSRSDDLNIKNYVTKGWDNFIKYVESLRDTISSDKLISYNDFLDWLYTNQKNEYHQTPTQEEVARFREERANN